MITDAQSLLPCLLQRAMQGTTATNRTLLILPMSDLQSVVAAKQLLDGRRQLLKVHRLSVANKQILQSTLVSCLLHCIFCICMLLGWT